MANGNVPVNPRYASTSTDPAELARQAREAQAYIQGKGPPVEEGGGITLGYGGGAVGYTRSIRTPIVFQPAVPLPNVSRSQINRIEQIRNSFSAPNVFFTGFKGSNVGPDVLLGVQQNIRVQRFNQFVEQALDSQSAKASEIEQKTSELNREAQKLQEDSDRFSRNVNNYDERTYQFAVSDLTTRIDSFNQKAAELENEANRFNSQSRALEMQLKAQAEQLERQNIRTSSLREREPLNIITRSEKPFSGSKDTSLAEPVAPLSDKRVITAGPLSEFNLRQQQKIREYESTLPEIPSLQQLIAKQQNYGVELAKTPSDIGRIQAFEFLQGTIFPNVVATGGTLGQAGIRVFNPSNKVRISGNLSGVRSVAVDDLFATGPTRFKGTQTIYGIEETFYGLSKRVSSRVSPFDFEFRSVSKPATTPPNEFLFVNNPIKEPIKGTKAGGFTYGKTLEPAVNQPLVGMVTKEEVKSTLLKLATPSEYHIGPINSATGFFQPQKGSLTIKEFLIGKEKLPQFQDIGIKYSLTGGSGGRISTRGIILKNVESNVFEAHFQIRTNKQVGVFDVRSNVKGTLFGKELEPPKASSFAKKSIARSARQNQELELFKLQKLATNLGGLDVPVSVPKTTTLTSPTISLSSARIVVQTKTKTTEPASLLISGSALALGNHFQIRTNKQVGVFDVRSNVKGTLFGKELEPPKASSFANRSISQTRVSETGQEFEFFPIQSLGTTRSITQISLQEQRRTLAPAFASIGPQTILGVKQSQEKQLVFASAIGLGFSQEPALGFKQKQEQRVRFLNAQVQLQGLKTVQRSRTLTPLRPFVSPPPYTPRPIKPPFRPPPIRLTKRKGFENEYSPLNLKQGFDVFVRRKGKRVRVASGLPIGRALAFGARTVAGTIAASFSLGRGRPTRQSDIAFRLGQQFRPSKRGLGFVERRRYRLDQPFEVQQIQSARKQKRKK